MPAAVAAPTGQRRMARSGHARPKPLDEVIRARLAPANVPTRAGERADSRGVRAAYLVSRRCQISGVTTSGEAQVPAAQEHLDGLLRLAALARPAPGGPGPARSRRRSSRGAVPASRPGSSRPKPCSSWKARTVSASSRVNRPSGTTPGTPAARRRCCAASTRSPAVGDAQQRPRRRVTVAFVEPLPEQPGHLGAQARERGVEPVAGAGGVLEVAVPVDLAGADAVLGAQVRAERPQLVPQLGRRVDRAVGALVLDAERDDVLPRAVRALDLPAARRGRTPGCGAAPRARSRRGSP